MRTRHRQADRQAGRQADRQADRQTVLHRIAKAAFLSVKRCSAVGRGRKRAGRDRGTLGRAAVSDRPWPGLTPSVTPVPGAADVLRALSHAGPGWGPELGARARQQAEGSGMRWGARYRLTPPSSLLLHPSSQPVFSQQCCSLDICIFTKQCIVLFYCRIICCYGPNYALNLSGRTCKQNSSSPAKPLGAPRLQLANNGL